MSPGLPTRSTPLRWLALSVLCAFSLLAVACDAFLERLSKPSEAGCTGKFFSVGNWVKAGAWRANFSPRNCGSELSL